MASLQNIAAERRGGAPPQGFLITTGGYPEDPLTELPAAMQSPAEVTNQLLANLNLFPTISNLFPTPSRLRRGFGGASAGLRWGFVEASAGLRRGFGRASSDPGSLNQGRRTL